MKKKTTPSIKCIQYFNIEFSYIYNGVTVIEVTSKSFRSTYTIEVRHTKPIDKALLLCFLNQWIVY